MWPTAALRRSTSTSRLPLRDAVALSIALPCAVPDGRPSCPACCSWRQPLRRVFAASRARPQCRCRPVVCRRLYFRWRPAWHERERQPARPRQFVARLASWRSAGVPLGSLTTDCLLALSRSTSNEFAGALLGTSIKCGLMLRRGPIRSWRRFRSNHACTGSRAGWSGRPDRERRPICRFRLAAFQVTASSLAALRRATRFSRRTVSSFAGRHPPTGGSSVISD